MFQHAHNNTAQLRQLSIELAEGDVCFAPGDTVSGFVLIGVSQLPFRPIEPEERAEAEQNQVEIIELKLHVHGAAKVRGRHRGNPAKERTYLDAELDLMGAPPSLMQMADGNNDGGRGLRAGEERLIPFQFPLPAKGLCTSLESKSASVLYTLRASLVYRTSNNDIRHINAVRGISVVERFDLALLPPVYFQPASHHLVKKFGLFSCTGGQIRLHFSICRSAFVCGENIIIDGRIENRTDRRVDKVAALLQQVVVVYGNSTDVHLNLLDVADIHEDNLALFVDQGTTLKIDRNFALPPLPPSTVALDGSDPCSFASAERETTASSSTSSHNLHLHHPHFNQMELLNLRRPSRRSFSGTRMSHGQVQPGVEAGERRFLKVLYQLSVRVKTGGVEVMEINVPIAIGSLPQRTLPPPRAIPPPDGPQNSFTRAATEKAASLSKVRVYQLGEEDGLYGESGEPMALFMQNRKDATAKLGAPNETYICSKSQLSFTNRYPFYVNLPTSSKQSRKLFHKVSMLANAIRAENTFVAALRQEQTDEAAKKKQIVAPAPKKTTSVPTTEARRSTTAGIPPSTAPPNGAAKRRASALPPVEVLPPMDALVDRLRMCRAGSTGTA